MIKKISVASLFFLFAFLVISGSITYLEDSKKTEETKWALYQNKKYGFEFNYPTQLVLSEHEGIDSVGTEYFNVDVDSIERTKYKCTECGGSTFFQISRLVLFKKESNFMQCDSELDILSEVIINGIKAKKCFTNGGMNGPLLSVWFKSGENTYYIMNADYYESSQKDLIDNIVATFRLTK